MAASRVSAVNEVSEVTTFEFSEFIRCKVTEMQSLSDVTIKMFFVDYFLLTNGCFMKIKLFMPHLVNYELRHDVHQPRKNPRKS